MPGAYVGGEVVIGDNVYIGVGIKLVGKVHIADGLSTDRDKMEEQL